VNRSFSGASRRLAAGALVVLASLVLGSCGSGAVSGSSATATSTGPITITPATATLFADLPSTFVVSGGNGAFIVTSSDQQALPSPGAVKGAGSFTVVPNQVAADTPVTLTVTDTAGTAPASAALTVKPRTVSNVVTVTPSASQSAACGTAVCSGGDAEVKVVLSQAGIPLVGRTVQFDVLSGEIRIIASLAGVSEDDELTGTTTTDSSGTARIRVRVNSSATSQTALLRVTDVSSGSSQTVSITIAPGSNAPLNAQPATIHFTGPTDTSCATGTNATVIVFGGRPPYTLSSPGTFSVSPQLLTASGSTFTVGATGQCSDGSPIAIVDANGASVTVTASNVPGNGITLPPILVAPADVTFTNCGEQANVVLAGGLGSYFVTQQNGPVQASVTGSIGTIAFGTTSGIGSMLNPVSGGVIARIGFSDGQSVASVTAHLPGSCT
jgi:hypothetical protein